MNPVRLATDADRDAWNVYIDTHHDIPPLVCYEWRYVLEKSYRVPTYFFLARDSNEAISGVCATYVTKPWGGRPTLHSLRFGLLADGQEVGRALLSHVRQFCSREGIERHIVTSGYSDMFSDRSAQVKKTVVMELASSEDEMWKGLRNKTRNMLRKAKNAGLTIECGFENLDAFYRIYARRMLEKKVPIHSIGFFKHVAKELDGCTQLLVATHNGVPVGGMLLLMGTHTALYPYQSSTSEGERYGANQLLVWEAMRFCLARDITTLDMGESKEGGSVYQSKINFGGISKDLYYYTFQDGHSSKFSELPGFIFAHVPVRIRGTIGPWIKKQSRIV